MMEELRNNGKRYRTPGEYPSGEDDFPKLRERGCVYEMTRMGYVFLSRPRRFGKSLLCSQKEEGNK